MMKKIIACLLSVLIFVGCCCFASAEEEIITGKLNVISYNVDGLPIPSSLSSTGRKVISATNLIAKQINNADCDILCVQEDFNLHFLLENGLDMNYATKTSGGVVIGDGLNIFSKHPIYNVGREAWNDAYGVFNCGSDELTPKGILYCTVEIVDGVYVDVYSIHADACEDDPSMEAKASQYDQLIELVEEHSGKDRAVIIAGDFNSNYALFRQGFENGAYKVDLCQKLIDNFIGHGFKDSWIEANADGRYDFTYGEMYQKYGCNYFGVWDTLDHIYYRDGEGVSFELDDSFYDYFKNDEISWDGNLSDHPAVRTTLNYTIDKSMVKAPAQKVVETKSPVTIGYVTNKIVSVLFKIIINIPDLIKNGLGWMK